MNFYLYARKDSCTGRSAIIDQSNGPITPTHFIKVNNTLTGTKMETDL